MLLLLLFPLLQMLLPQLMGEDADYDEVIAKQKSLGLGDGTQGMKIVPVNFSKEHKAMLGHCKNV
jgi:hypothetical protein